MAENRAPNRRVVYTTNIGSYDAVLPSSVYRNLPALGWDVLLFTDDERARSDSIRTVVPVSVLYNDIRMTSRDIKIRPHRWLPSRYDVSLYVDSNLAFDTSLVKEMARALDGDPPRAYVGFRHGDRNCAYDEADVVRLLRYDADATLDRQIQKYRDAALPRHWGLCENGLIMRRHLVSSVVRFDDRWFLETMTAGRRDQLSHAYTRWQLRDALPVSEYLRGPLRRRPGVKVGYHRMSRAASSRIAAAEGEVEIRSANCLGVDITAQVRELVADTGRMRLFLSKEFPLNDVYRLAKIAEQIAAAGAKEGTLTVHAAVPGEHTISVGVRVDESTGAVRLLEDAVLYAGQKPLPPKPDPAAESPQAILIAPAEDRTAPAPKPVVVAPKPKLTSPPSPKPKPKAPLPKPVLVPPKTKQQPRMPPAAVVAAPRPRRPSLPSPAPARSRQGRSPYGDPGDFRPPQRVPALQ